MPKAKTKTGRRAKPNRSLNRAPSTSGDDSPPGEAPSLASLNVIRSNLKRPIPKKDIVEFRKRRRGGRLEERSSSDSGSSLDSIGSQVVEGEVPDVQDEGPGPAPDRPDPVATRSDSDEPGEDYFGDHPPRSLYFNPSSDSSSSLSSLHDRPDPGDDGDDGGGDGDPGDGSDSDDFERLWAHREEPHERDLIHSNVKKIPPPPATQLEAFEGFLKITTMHGITKACARESWEYFCEISPSLCRFKVGEEENQRKNGTAYRKAKKTPDAFRHYDTLISSYINELPPVLNDVQYGYLSESGAVSDTHLNLGAKGIHVKNQLRDGRKILWHRAYVDLRAVKKFHDALPNHTCQSSNKIVLSSDGVEETKTGGHSLHFYTAKFEGCRVIYPVSVLKVDPKLQDPTLNAKCECLKYLLNDVKRANLEVTRYVADSVERPVIRNAGGHMSRYACDMCLAHHEHVPVQTHSKPSKRNKKVITTTVNKKCFPTTTMNQELRTQDHYNQMAFVARGQGSNLKESRGVKGDSLLHTILGADLTEVVLVDSMHAFSYGICKKLIECLFDIGRSDWAGCLHVRQKNIAGLNKDLRDASLMSECTRRSRALNYSAWRAQEFRNLFLFMFPLLLEHTQAVYGEDPKDRHCLIALTSFLMRASFQANDEYDRYTREEIAEASSAWYHKFEEIFGAHNCQFNIHLFR